MSFFIIIQLHFFRAQCSWKKCNRDMRASNFNVTIKRLRTRERERDWGRNSRLNDQWMVYTLWTSFTSHSRPFVDTLVHLHCYRAYNFFSFIIFSPPSVRFFHIYIWKKFVFFSRCSFKIFAYFSLNFRHKKMFIALHIERYITLSCWNYA